MWQMAHQMHLIAEDKSGYHLENLTLNEQKRDECEKAEDREL